MTTTKTEMIWYVYIVECADGTLYTGITNNVSKRVAKHNKKQGAIYTRSRTPVELVYFEMVGSKGFALRREHHIKMLPKKEKRNLIQEVPENLLTAVQ